MSAFAIATASFFSGLVVGILLGVSIMVAVVWLMSEAIDDEQDFMEEA